MFSKDITIVNELYDKTTKTNSYKCHQLKGFWSSNIGINISSESLIESKGVIVRILMSETGYVKPSEYTGAEGTWTLKGDDYIIKGKVDNVTSITTYLKDNECMKITDVAIKDYGSSEMQHYEVRGE